MLQDYNNTVIQHGRAENLADVGEFADCTDISGV